MQGPDQGVPVRAAEVGLGQSRELEVESVPASPKLRRVSEQVAAEGDRVRGVQDDQALHPVRMPNRDPPGNDPAPVVAHQRGPGATGVIDKADNVGRQNVERVISDARRFVTRVVTALVGGDDPVAGFGQRADLTPPAEPGLGEAVQQDDRLALLGPRLGDMQIHPVRPDGCVPEINGHDRSGAAPRPR